MFMVSRYRNKWYRSLSLNIDMKIWWRIVSQTFEGARCSVQTLNIMYLASSFSFIYFSYIYVDTLTHFQHLSSNLSYLYLRASLVTVFTLDYTLNSIGILWAYKVAFATGLFCWSNLHLTTNNGDKSGRLCKQGNRIKYM